MHVLWSVLRVVMWSFMTTMTIFFHTETELNYSAWKTLLDYDYGFWWRNALRYLWDLHCEISVFYLFFLTREQLQTYFSTTFLFFFFPQEFWVNTGLVIISLPQGVCGCSREDICGFFLSCDIKLQGGQSCCHSGRLRKMGVVVDGHYAAGWNSPLVLFSSLGEPLWLMTPI